MERGLMIKMENISKSFGFVKALEDVDFRVNYGEVVGLVGDNGAGKSTLIKILVGVYLPDKGDIFFEGREVRFSSPQDARERGIEPIYQELALFEDLSIERNIFAGREPKKSVMGGLLRVLDKQRMRKQSLEVLRSLKIKVDSTKTLAKNLSGGQRQTVAIGRALCFRAKVLVMDEPTAALGIEETSKILHLVKKLKEEQRVSAIFVSHNLPHVFSVADRITVLRHGRVVGDERIGETNMDKITKLITGRIK